MSCSLSFTQRAIACSLARLVVALVGVIPGHGEIIEDERLPAQEQPTGLEESHVFHNATIALVNFERAERRVPAVKRPQGLNQCSGEASNSSRLPWGAGYG